MPGFFRAGSFKDRKSDDLHHDVLLVLRRRRSDDGADGLGHAPLLSDDFPHILRGDGQLVHVGSLPFPLGDADLIRVIHQGPGDHPDQFFHGNPPCLWTDGNYFWFFASWAFFKIPALRNRLRTVSDGWAPVASHLRAFSSSILIWTGSVSGL